MDPHSTPTGSTQSRRVAELEASVSELRRLLRRIQAEREEERRRRRRRLLGTGVGISVVAHLILLLYFASIHRGGAGDLYGHPAGYEVAIMPLEQLSELSDLNLDDLLSEQTAELDDPTMSEPAVLSEAATPAGQLEAIGDGGVPGLGGAGEGEGAEGLGGAGTTYFGVAARGTRFAYIVDRSGSMMHRSRMQIAANELIRSIEALPDYAYFNILLFSSGPLMEPPMQRAAWVQARRNNVLQVARWLEGVSPGGGTIPGPAFHQVFSMDVRPDVIFFMTDGIIAGFTAEEVAALNRRGKRVVINTIAFGDDGSEELLRQIARDSGGVYRYVPDRE